MMTFRAWRAWTRGLPWALRWFVYLILLRSSIDALYFLKEVSPAFSPPYLVGILTPLLVGASFLFLRARRKRPVDLVFGFWAALVLFNIVGFLSADFSMPSLELALRLTIPLLLYFFLRQLVRSQRDLAGVLTTFLYSAVVPFAMMLYERLVAPLGEVIVTRGFIRYQGLYADSVTYAIYISCSLLVAYYFFLERQDRATLVRRTTLLVAVIGFAVFGLITIHHTSSWGVFLALSGLFLLHAASNRSLSVLAILLIVGGSVFFTAGDLITERIEAGLATDVEVIQGEQEVDRALHGRVWRWRRYVAVWREMTPAAWFLGVSVTSPRVESAMVGTGIHSDYLRVLFVSGIVGLAAYLLFCGMLFAKALRARPPERFLVLGALGVLLLYSVTTSPTFYAPLLYFCFAVFAYAALLQAAPQAEPVAVVERPHWTPLFELARD